MKNTTDDIDSRIASSLEKLTQVQKVLLWDTAMSEGLSPIQIQFIIFLNRHSADLRRVGILADEFDLTKATVSDAVKNLAKKGLLIKLKTQDDKRSYILELTAEGKKIAKKITNWQEILISHISRMSGSDKQNVSLFLARLIKSLFEEGIISVARMCTTCENFRKGRPNRCGLTGRHFTESELNFDCDSYSPAGI